MELINRVLCNVSTVIIVVIVALMLFITVTTKSEVKVIEGNVVEATKTMEQRRTRRGKVASYVNTDVTDIIVDFDGTEIYGVVDGHMEYTEGERVALRYTVNHYFNNTSAVSNTWISTSMYNRRRIDLVDGNKLLRF